MKKGCFVLSSPNCEYPALLGIITDIIEADSPEKETENEGDDIYIDFSIEEYGECRHEKLETHFKKLYMDKEKRLEEVPLDMLIMSEDELVVLTKNQFEQYRDDILEDEEFAASLYQKMKDDSKNMR